MGRGVIFMTGEVGEAGHGVYRDSYTDIFMTGEVGEAGHGVYRDGYTDPSSPRGSPPADQGR